jgi:hypothetical protein
VVGASDVLAAGDAEQQQDDRQEREGGDDLGRRPSSARLSVGLMVTSWCHLVLSS